MDNLSKSTADERARIEALIAFQEARVRKAFQQFLEDTQSQVVLRQVRLALEAGDTEGALRIVDSHIVRLGSTLNQVFIAAAEAEVQALAQQIRGDRAAVALSFDPSNPRAAQIMRANQLEFVRGFSFAQREAIQAALVEAMQQGLGPIQTARAFSDSIGLTEFQRNAVIKYRSLLEVGDAAALDRDLRDRRFDSSVARAVSTGEPLGTDRINRMTDLYRKRYLQYRAETIARTETQSAVNQARNEALQQVAGQINLPNSAIKRTWRATLDERTRDTHVILDGQVRAQGEPFTSISGARMLYPGDRSLGAGPEELINCRCVLLVNISLG